MKTIANSVSNNLLGLFITLGLLCTPLILVNYDALDALLQSMKNQWQNLAHWMACGFN